MKFYPSADNWLSAKSRWWTRKRRRSVPHWTVSCAKRGERRAWIVIGTPHDVNLTFTRFCREIRKYTLSMGRKASQSEGIEELNQIEERNWQDLLLLQLLENSEAFPVPITFDKFSLFKRNFSIEKFRMKTCTGKLSSYYSFPSIRLGLVLPCHFRSLRILINWCCFIRFCLTPKGFFHSYGDIQHGTNDK